MRPVLHEEPKTRACHQATSRASSDQVDVSDAEAPQRLPQPRPVQLTRVCSSPLFIQIPPTHDVCTDTSWTAMPSPCAPAAKPPKKLPANVPFKIPHTRTAPASRAVWLRTQWRRRARLSKVLAMVAAQWATGATLRSGKFRRGVRVPGDECFSAIIPWDGREAGHIPLAITEWIITFLDERHKAQGLFSTGMEREKLHEAWSPVR